LYEKSLILYPFVVVVVVVGRCCDSI
jgi:hypothetical protein